MAAQACGYQPAIRGMSNMPSGVFARGGDTTRQRQLGFTASITLAEGMERAIRYLDHETSRY